MHCELSNRIYDCRWVVWISPHGGFPRYGVLFFSSFFVHFEENFAFDNKSRYRLRCRHQFRWGNSTFGANHQKSIESHSPKGARHTQFMRRCHNQVVDVKSETNFGSRNWCSTSKSKRLQRRDRTTHTHTVDCSRYNYLIAAVQCKHNRFSREK